jgi:hypothetical protein
MPKTRQIALNGSGGAFIAIAATVPVRGIEFVEDEAAAMQGLQFKSPLDNFTATQTITAATEAAEGPVTIPNFHKMGLAGRVLAWPADSLHPGYVADTILYARSATATATVLRLTEYE